MCGRLFFHLLCGIVVRREADEKHGRPTEVRGKGPVLQAAAYDRSVTKVSRCRVNEKQVPWLFLAIRRREVGIWKITGVFHREWQFLVTVSQYLLWVPEIGGVEACSALVEGHVLDWRYTGSVQL
uniref:Putative secreted protein n=1 Tax=Ixodes ricinus TaxID=34613 RepID=A0A6B0UQ57_IXORI